MPMFKLATDGANPAAIPVSSENPLPVTGGGISLGTAGVATQLALVTNAATATLSKLKWPATFTVTLPEVGSGVAGVTNILESGNVVGGVFSPGYNWGGVLLDVAGAGAADQTTIIEVGRLTANGCMPQVIATPNLKSITTSGTFTANFNPFTGAAVASTTFRLYDLVTPNSRSGLGELLVAEGGTENDSPMQMFLDTTFGVFYYVLVLTLGVAGPITICITPTP